jgi:chromosome segregation ATPase
MINATPTQLRKAADIKERIDALQNELTELLGASGPAETATTEAPRKYKFSAAARAKMRAAQKARWAKIKGTAPEAEPPQKPKRKQLSEAKLKALAKAREARWAKIKETKPGKAAQKPKRKFSAAGRAALSAAAKARWAKVKAAGKSRL